MSLLLPRVDTAAIRKLQSVISHELQNLESQRLALLRTAESAEAEGIAVLDDWSLASDANNNAEKADQWRAEIDVQLSALNSAEESAAEAIRQATESLGREEFVGRAIPVAIGAAVLVAAAIRALAAAGLITGLGMLLFALMDELGDELSFADIIDNVPDEYLSDAGPVQQSDVQDELNARTDPGKNSPNRQMATEEEIRQLYDDLAREGKPLDVGGYPGQGTVLPDGTEIRVRDKSSSGGITIDIKYPDGSKSVKVHLP